MPSAMAATALSLESAEVPQMTAVLVCYRHSVSDCSMQKENRFLLVLSDWNLLPRLRQIRSAGTFGMHLLYCLRCNESALRFQRLQRRFRTAKGADAVMIKRMDTSLASYAALCRKTFPNVDAEFPGTGAGADLDLLFRRFFLLHWNPAFRSYWMKPDFVMM